MVIFDRFPIVRSFTLVSLFESTSHSLAVAISTSSISMNMMALVIIMLLLGIGYAHGKLRLGKSPKTEITFSPTFNGGKHVLPSWVLEQIDPLASSQATTITYPPCIDSEKDLAYVNGMLSETQTFYNCLQAITDPMSLPTKENGTVSGILPVYSSIQLNNLHEVRETMSFHESL